MRIVLIGIQGAGKSTQGNMLSEALKVPYLSSGHIFREMAKEKTPLGRSLKETLNAGILISDKLTLEIITEYLKKPEYVNGYILDGFPRTVPQAEQFEKNVDKAVFIDVSDKEALWRIAGRMTDREDETLQAVRKRIELFHDHTEPVLEFYRDRGMLVQVSGEKPVEDVFKEIMDFIN
jgi:adenylate kinase